MAGAQLPMRPLTAFRNRDKRPSRFLPPLVSKKSLRRRLEVKNMQLSMDAEKSLDLLLAAGLILRHLEEHLCAKTRERLSFRQSVWQQSES